jgi:tRNA nucleotidyltransferase (CCA-adding enzyme)
VVPRGSFASRTALRGTADLDLDVIFPDDYRIIRPGERADVLHQLKYILGMDASFEPILFNQESL